MNDKTPHSDGKQYIRFWAEYQHSARSESDVNTWRARSALMWIDLMFLCMWPRSSIPPQIKQDKWATLSLSTTATRVVVIRQIICSVPQFPMSVNEEEEEAAAGGHECECAQTATLDSRGEEEQEPL